MLHNNILRFSLCFKRQISYFYISINVKTTVKRTWCSSFELCVSPYVYIKRLEKFYKLTTKIRFVWMSSPYKFIYIYIYCCYGYGYVVVTTLILFCVQSHALHTVGNSPSFAVLIWAQPKFCGALHCTWHLGNGSWLGLLHRVMDARRMLGEHETSVRVGPGDSRGREKLQMFQCSPNFPSAFIVDGARQTMNYFFYYIKSGIKERKTNLVVFSVYILLFEPSACILRNILWRKPTFKCMLIAMLTSLFVLFSHGSQSCSSGVVSNML